jgi:3'(2'), 5'-bisphosphate nucleotidase
MGPTSIWDTAAGHAILAGAGGVVINLAQECELDYTDPRKVLNPSFMAYAPKRVELEQRPLIYAR